jgi:N-acetylmuramoyl-L-alanine amidase
MSRLIRFTFVFGLTGLLVGCGTVAKNTSRTFKTVTVDAGHGGKDSGAYRRNGPPEKAVALDVARRLDRKLRESQLKTVMTRSGDVFVSLDQRVAIGNGQRNSIFVSIHFNDSPRRVIHGFETYYYSSASLDLAQRIQKHLSTMPGAVNRGVHRAGFRVLRNLSYPSVLVECGFLSNRSDRNEAGSDVYRERLADKIAEAIVEQRFGAGMYNRTPTPPSPPPPPAEGPGLVSPKLFPP